MFTLDKQADQRELQVNFEDGCPLNQGSGRTNGCQLVAA